MTLAQISAIGYALYLWGAMDNAFGTSLWLAFLLWLKMVIGGVAMAILAMLMPEK